MSVYAYMYICIVYVHGGYMYIDLCVFMCMNIVCMFSYVNMFVYMYV